MKMTINLKKGIVFLLLTLCLIGSHEVRKIPP